MPIDEQETSSRSDINIDDYQIKRPNEEYQNETDDEDAPPEAVSKEHGKETAIGAERKRREALSKRKAEIKEKRKEKDRLLKEQHREKKKRLETQETNDNDKNEFENSDMLPLDILETLERDHSSKKHKSKSSRTQISKPKKIIFENGMLDGAGKYELPAGVAVLGEYVGAMTETNRPCNKIAIQSRMERLQRVKKTSSSTSLARKTGRTLPYNFAKSASTKRGKRMLRMNK